MRFFDIETEDLESKKIVAIVLDGTTLYMPSSELVKKAFIPGETAVAHNAKFDYKILLASGIKLEKLEDTMIAASLLNRARLSLKDLAKDDLNRNIIAFKEFCPDGNIYSRSSKEIVDYCKTHVKTTKDLYNKYIKEIKAKGLEDLFKLECEFLLVLAEMEHRGIKIDLKLLKERRDILVVEQEESLKILRNYADINFNSSQQLAEVLFDQLDLPILDYTPKGKPSTKREVLENYDHPFVDTLLVYKKNAKLLNTFIEPFLETQEDEVFSTYHQVKWVQGGTVTGRLSSSKPNLQNIPKETRNVFIPRKGKVFIKADYNQIELRLLAHFSQDKALMEAYKEGKDIHSITAETILHSKDKRKEAKTLNFSVIYGLSADTLAKRLRVHHAVAQTIIRRYNLSYPGIGVWKEKLIAEVQKNRQMKSLLGRIYKFPYGGKSAREKRQIVNYKIQGSASEVCKLAMVNIYKRHGLVPVLQVHDELVYEVPVKEAKKWLVHIKNEMEQVVELSLPLTVEIKKVRRWE